MRERPFHHNCGKLVKCDECIAYDQYLALRERILREFKEGMDAHLKEQGVDEEWEHSAHYTCDDCPIVLKCQFAFDQYNTNGDCLASK